MVSISSQGASMSSPSSSSTPQWKYDVFLSFRGEDTRRSFTDHLYDALQRKGILTFRDDEGLERGKSISQELLKAIEESRFAIVIFSKNYASSTWCLDELAKIVRCMRETGLTTWPVFYDVDPSAVRKPAGTFEQAINEHKKRFKHDITKVEIWKAALAEVANISGWHLQDRHESEFIQHIVKEIMKKLSSKPSSVIKNFIGMEFTMEKFIPLYLGFENNVRMIGIYGMGGLGKTTLARVVYDEFHSHFEGSSFIANVREDSKKYGLPQLQQQLLADILEDRNIYVSNVYDGVVLIKKRLPRKKVLLVIDDVDHLDQLTNLAGEEDWFGLGSWIIITTRDEHVLKVHGVLNRYNPNGLNTDDALKLFSLKAFKNEQPEEGYMQLSQAVVKYASGLPLALITLGSFLFGRTVVEWQSALYSFKETEGEIFDILKISYDGLKEMWKKIFLDIACFFRGWKENKVIEILENCGFQARIGISVLFDKSLLTVNENGSLEMHDLLQEMGEKIVRFESGGNLGMQSRLWLIKDLLHVLENDKATKAIEAIVVTYEGEDYGFEKFPDGFSKMSNLRLLIMKWGYLKSWWNNRNALNDQKHLALPSNIRYLSWRSCPFQYLAFEFERTELVYLKLRSSKFECLREKAMFADKLKFIDLSHSQNLIRTPDFSEVLILEKLDLSTCHGLVEIHPSIGQLSKLRYLNLESCDSLTDLPSMSAKMQSLTVLNLNFCFKISSFPKFTGIMKSLFELKLSGTAIKKVESSSIECLTALTLLDLSCCKYLECLPSNMDNLRSLETLNLYECKKLESLPVRLPSTIKYMMVKCCSSLKWKQKWVKLSIWSQLFSQWFPYDERRGRVGFKILFHFLQGLLCCKAVLYGSIISTYLTHQGVEYSISIKLPSNWYNSKWIGFALWTSLSDATEEDRDIRARVIALCDIHHNHCAFEFFPILISYEVNICLLHLSRDDWLAKVGNGECNQIKVIFETDKRTLYMEECWVSLMEECLMEECLMEECGVSLMEECGVSLMEECLMEECGVSLMEECGVSLIYKQDVNEFNQTNAQCLIKSFGEEVCIYKLTAGDDDDDVHIVNNDDDDVLIFGDDDFDDDDI